MKKIFTLVAMALIGGGSICAQTEIIDVTSEEVQTAIANAIANPIDNSNPNFISVPQDEQIFPEGTYSNGDFSVVTGGKPVIMKDYIWTVSTQSIVLKAVSTPNTDAQPNESWQVVSNNSNMQLDIEEYCSPKFTKAYKGKNGNPSIAYKEFYDYNGDGAPVFRVGETLWSKDCGELPQKGLYYEFTAKAKGTLKIGVYIHRISGVGTFVVDKTTKEPLPVSAMSLEGFMNNNTWDGFEGKLWHTYTINPETYQIEAGGQNRAVFGYLTFAVEAGKSYLVFNDKQQMGLYGFEFTPDAGGAGINDITAGAAVNPNAPVYNLAGQRVAAPVKGQIYIQNGKKFVK